MLIALKYPTGGYMNIIPRKRINPPPTSPQKALKQTPKPNKLRPDKQKAPLNSRRVGVTKFSAETASLLDSCRQWVHQYVIVTTEQGNVIAAWILHTWAILAAEFTPYLHITAPEKHCGKSRLLETLEPIVYAACRTEGMTSAALVRTIDKESPTLLLDEVDPAFGGNKEFAESLRLVLNAGFRRGGNVRKCDGRDHELRAFQVFGPKAFAGIGKIPDTVASRSIAIEMRRKLPEENVKPFRSREVKKAAETLRRSLEAWANSGVIKDLQHARPTPPEGLTDRQGDIIEPLLAVADLAAGEWPAMLRTSLSVLFRSVASADASWGVILLRDIRAVFSIQTGKHANSIYTTDVVAALNKLEDSPWSGWNKGKGMTSAALAKLLKPYNIAPGTVRIGISTNKGYKRESFIDVWNRYLGPLSE
jgi:hypothetical protein